MAASTATGDTSADTEGVSTMLTDNNSERHNSTNRMSEFHLALGKGYNAMHSNTMPRYLPR